MLKKLQTLWKDDEGQAMVEYGIIVALISIAAIVAITAIGPKLITLFTNTGTALP
jgi:pilus assembly protein Flp/PilA